MNKERFLDHIKWCFDNDMNHLIEVFLDEYMEGYQSDESYNDGFDDGYKECLKENGSVDLDDMDISYDYFRERFDYVIDREIEAVVDEELSNRAYSIKEEVWNEAREVIWDEAYDEGYDLGYRKGHEEGYEEGFEEGSEECE